MKDFRLTAYCNIVYKCYSKILTERLKLVLPSTIGYTQNAFSKERSIADNVMLMKELARGYSWENGQPRCDIEVDLMKAYDTVKWKFLLATMKLMGFPQKFMKWIENCVKTASFLLNLNGSLIGYFNNQRGPRQGDLVSSNLFLIAMEVFSLLLSNQIQDDQFDFHSKCKDLTHLIFVDELCLLSAGTQKAMMEFKQTLSDF